MGTFFENKMIGPTLLLILALAAPALSLIRPLPQPKKSSRNTYFVSAPKEITRGMNYDVSVDILNGTNVEVTAILQERKYNSKSRKYDNINKLRQTGVFSQGSTGTLTMPIGDNFNCNQCQLVVQGRGSQIFERSTSVPLKNKLLSVLIQTDKAIYKPGQRVRYRAFAVYPNLKSYRGSFDIVIKDPNNNKISVLKNKMSGSGVVEGFLNLSDEPPYGTWTIEVTAPDVSESGSQNFVVDQYELPRFEVTVDLDSFALISDSKLSGTVKAKYTFGKPVKGLVELMVGPDDGPDHCGKLPRTVNSAFEIDGESSFTVPKSSIQRVMSIYHATKVRVTAIVKEEATGVKLNGSNVMQYFTNRYNMEFTSNTPNVFKPGLQYTAYVQIKSPDDLPPPASPLNKITIYPSASYRTTVPDQSHYGVSYFIGSYPLPKFTVDVPVNGIAAINVMNIPINATEITLQAEISRFGNLSTNKKVQKMESQSINYIQLTMENSDIKSGQTANFLVKGTESLNKVTYEILARGAVTKSGVLDGKGKTSFKFEINIEPHMGPVATLITYYTRKTGEIVADSISFNVDDIFDNKVTVEFNKNQSEPHTPIELKVSADPGSNVFLLAVDQSVLLLKSGNDIDPQKVQNLVSDQKQMDSELAETHSARDVSGVFRKAGLIYLTDAFMEFPRPLMSRKRTNLMSQRGFPGPNVGYSISMEDDMGFDMPMPSGQGSSGPLKTVKRIRNVFPEAWLWTDVVVNGNGNTVINTTVPDTITTWIASAFATNKRSGLGVSPFKAEMTVFRQFFVSLTYPSTIKRNEQAVIQVTVFNYLPVSNNVMVTMKGVTGFKPIRISGESLLEVVEDGSQSESVQVSANSHAVVYFPITAKEVGVFDVAVVAQSGMASDGVKRQITIEPEGVPESYNVPIFIDNTAKTINNTFKFPESTVSGSQSVIVGVSGDLLGPSFDNINELLSIPMGCGEQNMVRFAPNVYIARYLTATGQMTDRIKEDVIEKLSAGYQRQLTYQRSDNSFSAFGNSDQSGSTWLTAYVTRSFSEGRQFIYVDPQILVNGINWLVDRQREDGSFVELGNVIDPNIQGKETGPALTAQCLLALLQNKNLLSKHENCTDRGFECLRTKRWMDSMNKSISHLESLNLKTIHNPFTLAVVTYALIEARSGRASRAFRQLKKIAVADGDTLHWNGSAEMVVPMPRPLYSYSSMHSTKSRPINILVTSYALLCYKSKGYIRQAVPIIRWLTQQRNAMGGFSSTQDTTVALQALSAIATRTYDPESKMSLSFLVNDADTFDFTIDTDNRLSLQRKQIQTSNDYNQNYNVALKTSGSGYAMAEINYNFHVNEVELSDSFDVSTVFLDDEVDNFNLMVCTKWLKKGDTGMVVQEIEIPSGFEPDLASIGNVADMKRFERRGNVAAIYFDQIGKTSTCYSLIMSRKSKVARAERSYVKTTRYYNPADKSTVFYQPRRISQATICDVCPACSPSC